MENNKDLVVLIETESKGEILSVKARQRRVAEALLSQGMKVAEDSNPPVIAVMGSGGGLRAMIAFLGTLGKLAELKILDVVTYVCGTSGSTWCISSLCHSSKNWSNYECMEDNERKLLDQLTSPCNWKKSWRKLKERFLNETPSLTHFWAYGVVHWMINDINEGKLSNHRDGCETGENPYPIYSAVEKNCLNTSDAGAWFEFTPHMSGFPAYRSYVKTELLGSQFEAGKLIKKHPENDLCYLQGLWGSAFASDDVIHGILKSLYHHLIAVKSEEKCMEKVQQEDNVEEPSHPCNSYNKIDLLLSQDLAGMTEERKKKFWSEFADAIEETVKNILEETAASSSPQFSKDLKALKSIIDCVCRWRWGTTHNILYKLKSGNTFDGMATLGENSSKSDDIFSDLSNKETISLIDAGLEINTAFPLMLPPNRKVDLILSFDFSEGDPFLTLKQTVQYCEKNEVPFPTINTEDVYHDIPSKNCYIFEGDGNGRPDVMHFPLFNNETCKGKVEEMREKYRTANISYDESALKGLLDIAKNNVEKRKDLIQEKIKQCIESCNQRRSAETAGIGVEKTSNAE